MCHYALGMICLLVALPLSAAEPTKKESAGISFILPDKWKVLDEKGNFAIHTADKDVIIVLVELKPAELKKVKKKAEIIKYVEAMGVLKEPEIDDEDAGITDTQHGLTSTDFSGNATFKDGDKKGKDTEFFVTILEGGKVPLLFFGYGDLEKHEKQIDDLFDSMRKLAGKKK